MTKRTDNTAKTNNTQGNPFVGCRIVATGKLKNFTRNGINSKIASIGGIAGSSVTSKTNLSDLWGKTRKQAGKSKGAGDSGSNGAGIS